MKPAVFPAPAPEPAREPLTSEATVTICGAEVFVVVVPGAPRGCRTFQHRPHPITGESVPVEVEIPWTALMSEITGLEIGPRRPSPRPQEEPSTTANPRRARLEAK